MKLVLRSNVDGVGKRGDIVDVSDGYGRNFLIPKGLASRATDGVEREAVAMRRVEAQRDAQSREQAELVASRLASLPMTIAARAGEEGRLFGSVGATEIVGAAEQAGIEIERRAVQLDEPLKELGDHSVTVVLHPDVVVAVNVTVVDHEV